jgi:hypothetical protein
MICSWTIIWWTSPAGTTLEKWWEVLIWAPPQFANWFGVRSEFRPYIIAFSANSSCRVRQVPAALGRPNKFVELIRDFIRYSRIGSPSPNRPIRVMVYGHQFPTYMSFVAWIQGIVWGLRLRAFLLCFVIVMFVRWPALSFFQCTRRVRMESLSKGAKYWLNHESNANYSLFASELGFLQIIRFSRAKSSFFAI